MREFGTRMLSRAPWWVVAGNILSEVTPLSGRAEPRLGARRRAGRFRPSQWQPEPEAPGVAARGSVGLLPAAASKWPAKLCVQLG